MSHHTQSNKYAGLEPEFMLLLAMIELAQRDAGKRDANSESARLFLVWCDSELRYYLEDVTVFSGVMNGK